MNKIKWALLTFVGIVLLLWITNPSINSATKKVEANIKLSNYELCRIDNYLFSQFVLKFTTYTYMPNRSKYKFEGICSPLYLQRSNIIEPETYFIQIHFDEQYEKGLPDAPPQLLQALCLDEPIKCSGVFRERRCYKPMETSKLELEKQKPNGINSSEYEIASCQTSTIIGYGLLGKVFLNIKNPKKLNHPNQSFEECEQH